LQVWLDLLTIDMLPQKPMETTEQRLQAIFRGVLELPADGDPTTAVQGRTPTWDSMAHVTLVAAIEAEFGVTIDAGDSLSLTSYETTRQFLADLGG
jgi:acyl carrier protein